MGADRGESLPRCKVAFLLSVWKAACTIWIQRLLLFRVAAAELMHARSYEQEDLVEQILKPVDGALTRLNLSAEAIASPFK